MVAIVVGVCDGDRVTVLVARVGIVQPVLVRAWRARQASGYKTLPPQRGRMPNFSASISHRTAPSQPSDLDYMLRQFK